MSNKHHQEANEKINEAFKSYDKNNNGLLERSEIKQLLKDLVKKMFLNRKVTDEDVDQFINEADTNNDGKLDRNEFLQMFKKINGY